MGINKHRKHARFFKGLLCFFVALSFLAVLVPIAASANSSNAMPCCAGKSGHCDSGIAAKKPPQPAEPMCGLHVASAEDDGITIVAEPSPTEHHHASQSSSTAPAVDSASLTQPCRMECGACAGNSLRQQKRERGVVQPIIHQNSLVSTPSKYENLSLLFSSNDDWKSTSPRGPPADLL